MGNSIYKRLSSNISGMQHAAIVLGIFSFGSQILALLRDRLLANIFGASEMLDAYYAAFRIPDLVFILVGSIVSISVTVPLFSNLRETSLEAMKEKFNSLFTFFLCVITIVSALAFLLIPTLLSLFFPGFSEEMIQKVIPLSRIMLLSPFLLGLSSLFSSIVQVERRFIIYSLSPLLYNIGIIIGIIALYPLYGLPGLAFGVALGAFFHMFVQYPYVRSAGFSPRLTSFSLKDIWGNIVTPSIPRTLTLSLTQFLSIIMLGLVTQFGIGSVAILSLAYNLQSVPLSLIGVSYSLSAFSLLATLYAEEKIKEFEEGVERAFNWIAFFAIPATYFSLIFHVEIVSLLLGTGSFSSSAQIETGTAFLFFSISILFQSLTLLLTRVFYATGDTWRPFYAGIVGFGVSAGLMLLISYNVLGRSPADFALAFTLGSITTTILLLVSYIRTYNFNYSGLFDYLTKLLFAWGAGGSVAFLAAIFISVLLPLREYSGIVISTVGGVVTGIVTGILILNKMRVDQSLMVSRLATTKLEMLWKNGIKKTR